MQQVMKQLFLLTFLSILSPLKTNVRRICLKTKITDYYIFLEIPIPYSECYFKIICKYGKKKSVFVNVIRQFAA